MKKKKLIKRILFFFLFIIILLIALPLLLKDTLIKKYIEKINNDYNIQIAYNDIDISLIRHFPSVTITINELSIITEKPFKGDTLVYANKIFLDINIKDAFKSDAEKIKIKNLTFSDTKINLLVNKNGKVNYSIEKYNELPSKKLVTEKVENQNNDSKPITLEVSKYNLKNANILFDDKQNNTLLSFKNLNHTGSGDFTASTTDLMTKTTIDELTIKQGNVAYFNKAKLDLDAILALDFDQNKYTFKENTVKINDLAINFDGFVKLNENDIDTDISFQSSKTNFKSILSLIPSAYSSDFKDVTANGIANISGLVKGKSSDKETPKYNIKIKTTNASFKYPDLPKQVSNIELDGALVSNSASNNPFLSINKLKFTIDKDTFETTGKITNLMSNPAVNAAFKGTLDLENLTKAYPIKIEDKFTGILNADFTTQMDQRSIETNNFNKIKTNGNASLQDFSYSGNDVAHTVYVKNANVKFNTNTITLTDFNAKTGESDIKASGTLDNLYAFLFDKKDLKGNFKVNSNNFVISDFLVDENKETTSTSSSNKSKNDSNTNVTESLKIPDFLDVTTTVNAKRVVYDNLILENVTSSMQLKDQKAILRNTKAKMLQGNVSFNGIVDTKKIPSTFDLDLVVDDFDIANSFSQLETFKKLIPIAKALKGKYDTTFKIEGNLNNDFSPNMNSIKGKALAELFIDNINQNENPLFQALGSKIRFLDLKKLNLDKLVASLSFKEGRVHVNPFKLNYEDIEFVVSGNHGFDTSLNYDLNFNVPAKYLGKEANTLLAQISNVHKDTIKVPLHTFIKGSVLKPTVTADFKTAIKNLALKVANYKKNELLNQATEQVNNVITDAIGENETVNDILTQTGIFKPKDSTNTKPKGVIENTANNLINGLFGKKKKKKKGDK